MFDPKDAIDLGFKDLGALRDKTPFFSSTFFRGTSNKDEIDNITSGRLVSGKVASSPLASMSAETINTAIVSRVGFEAAAGAKANTVSCFIPLSTSFAVSKGFGKSGNVFQFDIQFVLVGPSLDKIEVFKEWLDGYVKAYKALPSDICPLFVGSLAEKEILAYTGTAIKNVIKR